MSPTITELLDRSRKELLDLSMRNRLLSIPMGSKSSRMLSIQDELSEQVFRLLVTETKAMSFLPARTSQNEEVSATAKAACDEEVGLPQPGDEEDLRTGPLKHHTDLRLQTALSSESLQTRLLALYRDAQTMIEEQGINILYLSLGQLKWFEAKDSDTPRFAPLILVPIELRRKSASDRFYIVWREEDIEENLSLEAKLKAEFGIKFPFFPEEEELSPTQYFEEVRKCISQEKGWQVIPDAITLGFFSFAKFLMYRDLDPANWPQSEKLLTHPLLTALLQDGFPQKNSFFSSDAHLDELIPASRLDHVVDADSSQTVAIEMVRQGRNLVIQGPPGTGKSQTITNIIATAALDGKKVLFLAEKMAALDVVKRRLEKEGLGPLCLELHSNKSHKRAVIEEIGRAWNLGRPKAADLESLVPKLEQLRQRLNDHVRTLHETMLSSGLSPYVAMGQLVLLGDGIREAADLSIPNAERWTPTVRAECRQVVEDLASRIEQMGVPSQHPWRGIGRANILHIDLASIEIDIRELVQRLAALDRSSIGVAQSVVYPAPKTLSEANKLLTIGQHIASAPPVDKTALCHGVWDVGLEGVKELVTHGRRFARTVTNIGTLVTEETWAQDFSKLRSVITSRGKSLLRFLDSEYRNSVTQLKAAMTDQLPTRYEDRIALIDNILVGQQALRAVARSEELGASAFGILWRRQHTNWDQLAAIVEWVAHQHETGLGESFRQTFAGITDPTQVGELGKDLSMKLIAARDIVDRLFDTLKLDCAEAFGVKEVDQIPAQALLDRCHAWLSNLEGVIKWSNYFSRALRGRALGLEALIARMEAGTLPSVMAPAAFDRIYYSHLLREFVRQRPELAQFDGDLHTKHVTDFCQQDKERLGLSKYRLLLKHFENMPISSGVGAAGIMRAEMERKRGHRTVRRLLKDCGSIVQAIKPVFMMSPLSISQFLDPGLVEFDLLVMDEASQIQPVDALGAIARCKQIVVVGDGKQLPPTRFFSRLTTDSEDVQPEEGEIQTAEAKDMESILSLCCARGVPETMLRWHYRSKHHSLIAVSNHEFYDDGLFIVPSPHADPAHMGVQFTFVSGGIFDSGKSNTNRIEAKKIGEAVVEHARKTPQFTLGVAAFSVSQRQAILDELELLRREHPDVELFLAAHPTEPFFVKNLENVQGDERDVMFISVGYAKNQQGYMAMRFGPLSNDGGERRLNVLISRAKYLCKVFSSITADDIDLERASGRGVASLKTFLTFAKTKRLGISQRSGLPEQSPFEEAVRRALESAGYAMHAQVGIAGFFIDLAVVDSQQPGRYILGIECDGATYHSSRSARERDRLRETVLNSHGWTIHRIWSTDWFQRPNEQLRKAIDAIEHAKTLTPNEPDLKQAITNGKVTASPDDGIEREISTVNSTDRSFECLSEPYKEAWFAVPREQAPHEISSEQMASVVLRILEQEGPIHEDELATRVRHLWKLGRAGNRIQDAIAKGVQLLIQSAQCMRAEKCLSIPGQPVKVRQRGTVWSTSLRKPEMIPLVEIRAAISLLLDANHGATKEEIPTGVARIFGFKTTSTQLREIIDAQTLRLLREGLIQKDNGMMKISVASTSPLTGR